MSNRGKVSIVFGLLVLGLSPSFVDWQQSPDLRSQIVIYYGLAVGLIVFGLWDGG